jgi:hypothetical protein
MNDPRIFVKTIYLGDRYCKSLTIDGPDRRVSLTVDLISRIRDPSGHWNFYDKEDIEDGRIVFEQVTWCSIEPQGFLPSEWIDIVSVEPSADANGYYYFTISLGAAIDPPGYTKELTMKITAARFHLEDPKRPGTKILN